jgi:tyrosyl-tRNA synthetase
MDTKKRLDLIKKNVEEVMVEKDLIKLLDSGMKLKHYIGFEISGKPHLGHGLVCMSKVKDFTDAGIECSIFLADWHSWINDKLGGDREKIKSVAVNYFKEALIAAYKCVGGNPKDLKFVLGSDLYHNNDKYWESIIDISKNTTLSRMQRSITIMGRKEEGNVDFAKLIYPPMQVADIFIQGIHLAHAGLDQRKAQVVARECALNLKISPLLDNKGNKIKPIAIHSHLILGLQKPSIWPIPKENLQELWSKMKMSKSIPNSAVFMTDTEDEIRSKMKTAFCPQGETDFNPLLDWAKYIVFINSTSKLEIKRPDKFGGNITYIKYEDLVKDFSLNKLHPLDLKNAMGDKLIEILTPAIKHFQNPKIKKMKEEMEQLIVTR